MTRFFLFRFLCALFACFALAGMAVAAELPKLPKTEFRMRDRAHDDLVLFADEITTQNNTQIARGNVQIVSEPYVLLADEVSYQKEQDLLTARGNVRLMQTQPNAPPSEVIFSDYLELTTDLQQGQVINVRMLFADNSRLVARTAQRKSTAANTPADTELQQVVYSPCELCKTDPQRAPLWQLEAENVRHDAVGKRIRYENATMNIWGTPVFYLPYFSHPDPTVKQEQGFLPPVYITSNYLGALIRNYYYYPISPSQDVTAELSYATSQGPLLGAEWRSRMNDSQWTVRGATTYSEFDTRTNNEDKVRGYISAEGRLDIDRKWRAGTEIFYSGDPTFLRQYKYSSEDILKNRIYAERFSGRSYGVINAYAFQDLRPTRPGDQPNLVPYASFSSYGRPSSTWGGRWGFQAGLLGVTRPYGGQSMQRINMQGEWEREWITDIGLKHRMTTELRGDVYQVQSADAQYVGASRAGTDYAKGRIIPSLTWQTSMPFVKYGEYLQYDIEPLIALGAMPRLKNAGIPNEDSLDVELDSSNLMATSRFPGIDRVEDGQRVTYGLRTGFTNPVGGYAYAFVGQSLRLNGGDKFPAGSGLNSDRSDWVAQINAAPSAFMDLDYRTRLSYETLAPRRHEAALNLGPKWLRFGSNYAFLKQVENTGITGSRSQIINSVTAELNDNWRVYLSDTKDLDTTPKSLLTRLAVQYMDECFGLTLSAERDYTEREGISSGDSIMLTLSFKNLGDISSPAFNNSIAGEQSTAQ